MIEFFPMTPDDEPFPSFKSPFGYGSESIRVGEWRRFTIDVPANRVLCTIALDVEVAAAVELILSLGAKGKNVLGMSGLMFRACPIGPDADHRGGAIPLLPGPATTFECWLRNVSNYAVPARAVAGMEQLEPYKQVVEIKGGPIENRGYDYLTLMQDHDCLLVEGGQILLSAGAKLKMRVPDGAGYRQHGGSANKQPLPDPPKLPPSHPPAKIKDV